MASYLFLLLSTIVPRLQRIIMGIFLYCPLIAFLFSFLEKRCFLFFSVLLFYVYS
ncbi:hypothetical protein BJY00DRAFT_290796 [Aspergillus carlsbadensis]|nr:hypothetical protein BJY00DRAFT_290796 [Aspergillus carlsbadensis]